MKVIVKNNYLNVRVGRPSVNAPSYQYLAPGSIIDVDGQLYKGDSYDGIDTWMKDDAGNYYWSGGVGQYVSSKDYTALFSNYSFQWTKNKGKDITVVIIDTGIIIADNYYNSSKLRQINLSDDNEELYHGNFICGIIAGTSNITGIANNATILSIKFKSNTDNQLKKRLANLTTALEHVLQLNDLSVVNISQGFFNNQLTQFEEEKQRITELIKEISKKGKSIIFCAAGDNTEINDDIFPASLAECISVACIKHDYHNLPIKSKLDILTPMITFSSYNNEFEIVQSAGSSFSTAAISGLTASYLTGKNGTLTKPDIIRELSKETISKNNFDYDNSSIFQYAIL